MMYISYNGKKINPTMLHFSAFRFSIFVLLLLINLSLSGSVYSLCPICPRCPIVKLRFVSSLLCSMQFVFCCLTSPVAHFFSPLPPFLFIQIAECKKAAGLWSVHVCPSQCDDFVMVPMVQPTTDMQMCYTSDSDSVAATGPTCLVHQQTVSKPSAQQSICL